MSSRREVLIRIALLQRKTLIETKNPTLKCLKWRYSTVRGRVFALFCRPHPGDLTAQESPPPGICHPREKMLMSGGQPRGRGSVGAVGIDRCISAMSPSSNLLRLSCDSVQICLNGGVMSGPNPFRTVTKTICKYLF